MKFSLRVAFSLVITSGLLAPTPVSAAPNLIEVQGRVRDLEAQATTAAEGAQEAKVQLAKLKKHWILCNSKQLNRALRYLN